MPSRLARGAMPSWPRLVLGGLSCGLCFGLASHSYSCGLCFGSGSLGGCFHRFAHSAGRALAFSSLRVLSAWAFFIASHILPVVVVCPPPYPARFSGCLPPQSFETVDRPRTPRTIPRLSSPQSFETADHLSHTPAFPGSLRFPPAPQAGTYIVTCLYTLQTWQRNTFVDTATDLSKCARNKPPRNSESARFMRLSRLKVHLSKTAHTVHAPLLFGGSPKRNASINDSHTLYN